MLSNQTEAELTPQQQMELNIKTQNQIESDRFKKQSRDRALNAASYFKKQTDDVEALLKNADKIYEWLITAL